MYDSDARKVLKTSFWGNEVFRDVPEPCEICGQKLGIHYCESKVYAVRCEGCGYVILLSALSPRNAVERLKAAPYGAESEGRVE